MSTLTKPPTTTPGENGTSDGHAAPSAAREHDDALMTTAVREGATRATVAAALGGLVVIHALDAVGKWSETRYVFWLYVLAILAAIGAAGWTIFTRSRTALLASAAVAGSVLLGFVVNRTVGLPNATDDIGNWTEPLGLASMVVEAMTVAIATGAYALEGHRSQP